MARHWQFTKTCKRDGALSPEGVANIGHRASDAGEWGKGGGLILFEYIFMHSTCLVMDIKDALSRPIPSVTPQCGLLGKRDIFFIVCISFK